MCWRKIRKHIQRTTAWICVQDYGKDAVNPIEERSIITILKLHPLIVDSSKPYISVLQASTNEFVLKYKRAPPRSGTLSTYR
jgi:hypothetical protein